MAYAAGQKQESRVMLDQNDLTQASKNQRNQRNQGVTSVDAAAVDRSSLAVAVTRAWLPIVG